MDLEPRRAESEEAKRWADRCFAATHWDLEFSRFGPDGVIFPKSYGKWAKFIREMPVRSDDVWVVSFPKCGTTWTQEMVWLIGNDLNFEQAHEITLHDRFPYLEMDAVYRIPAKWNGTDDTNKPPTSMDIIDGLKSPRFIKSHLPLSLLPSELLSKNAKIVFVARNPKDACVSFYHHNVLLPGYTGTLDDFAETFITDNVTFSPFWAILQGFYDVRDDPNVLFLTYEEMKQDLKSVILRTAKFLGKTLTEDDIEKLQEHLSFEKMKSNPSVNWEEFAQAAIAGHNIPARTQFMRKGKVGSWRDEMSPEWIKKFDDWTAQNGIPGLYK